MGSQQSKTGTTVNLFKRLQKEQRDELRQLHVTYRTRIRTLSAEYKATYKKLDNQQERAALLTTFVQTRSHFRQAYNLEHTCLLALHSKQLEHLLMELAGFAELHQRGRIKSARTIIEAAIKSRTLCIALQGKVLRCSRLE